jgi:hypothetical protein
VYQRKKLAVVEHSIDLGLPVLNINIPGNKSGAYRKL